MTWDRTRTRQQRGYGRDHERMRERILREEPLCRECLKIGMVTATAIADHITPKAEGGGDERENYCGLCKPCHDSKTLAESARARGVSVKPRIAIAVDGWPVDR